MKVILNYLFAGRGPLIATLLIFGSVFPITVQSQDKECKGKIDNAGISGIFKSPSYPIYTSTQCDNTTLNISASSDLVIYMYFEKIIYSILELMYSEKSIYRSTNKVNLVWTDKKNT